MTRQIATSPEFIALPLRISILTVASRVVTISCFIKNGVSHSSTNTQPERPKASRSEENGASRSHQLLDRREFHRINEFRSVWYGMILNRQLPFRMFKLQFDRTFKRFNYLVYISVAAFYLVLSFQIPCFAWKSSLKTFFYGHSHDPRWEQTLFCSVRAAFSAESSVASRGFKIF